MKTYVAVWAVFFLVAVPAGAYEQVVSGTCGTCHSDYTSGTMWHTNHTALAHQQCTSCHATDSAADFGVATRNCLGCHTVELSTWVNTHEARGVASCAGCHGDLSITVGPDAAYDVVVIGAGGGGLAAAARLSLAGRKVLLIEQHGKVGGYMGGFTRGDYTFDVSLHAFTGANVELFTDLGIADNYKPVALDPMYQAVYPDYEISVPADLAAYKEILYRDFPHEAENLVRLFRVLDDYYAVLTMLTRIGEGKFFEALMAYRPGMFLPVYKYRNASITEFLDDFLADERLKTVFSQFAVFGGIDPAKQSVMFFGIIWNMFHRDGYYYFEGGSASIAAALQEVIEENGGEILLYTRASNIKIENGRAVSVQTADGSEYACRYVISNANVPQTFDELVGREHLPADYLARVDEMTIALSALHVYLGVDKDYSSLFPAGAHGIFVVPSWSQTEAFNTYYSCDVETMPYVIVNYSMVDPTVAPAGKNVICLNTMSAYDCDNDWKTKSIPADALTEATKSSAHVCAGCEAQYAEYAAMKQDVADTLIRRAEQFLPDLAAHVEVVDVGGPIAMKAFTSNPQGSIFGWENTAEQTMAKRLAQTTPINNLYLAGAWTSQGGGQVAVLLSGRTAADQILKRLVREDRWSAAD